MRSDISIRIDQDYFDVDEGTIVEATLQRDNLLDFTTKQLSYTNTISLPITERNAKLINYAHLDTGNNDFLKQSHEITIDVAGNNLFNRIRKPINIEGTPPRLSFRLIEEAKSFYEQLAPYKLYELVASNTAKWWRATYRLGINNEDQFNTSSLSDYLIDSPPYDELIYLPLVDLGEGTIVKPNNSRILLSDTRWMIPCFHVGNCLKTALARIGFSFQSSVLNDPLFTHAVITAPKLNSRGYEPKTIFGELTVVDLLKSIEFLLGGRFQPVDRTLTLVPSSINDGTPAEDFSAYLDYTREAVVNHNFGEWGLNNLFAYASPGVANPDDSFNKQSANLNRPPQYEAFKTLFARPYTDNRFSSSTLDNIARIDIINRIGTDLKIGSENDPVPTLLFLDQMNTEWQLEISSPSGDTFLRNNPSGAVVGSWNPAYNMSQVATKYNYLNDILSKHQVTVGMRIPPHKADADTLLQKKVYLNSIDSRVNLSGYYLITKVDAYRPGFTANVTLQKLP